MFAAEFRDRIVHLIREIVTLNPIHGCHIVGEPSDWDELPHDKSLYHSPEGCGLPIGNLTSQLFSNVYLNELDQFMKRTLNYRLRRRLMLSVPEFTKYGIFNLEYRKYYLGVNF